MSTPDPCLIYPDTIIYPWTLLYPGGLCSPVVLDCGGGGYGAVMSRRHFERYHVDGKWQHVQRVRATPKRRSMSRR